MEYKIGIYGNQKRRLAKIVCVNCGEEHWIPPHFVKEINYCSRECKSKYSRKRIIVLWGCSSVG